MVRTATVVYGSDGYRLWVNEVPMPALIADWLMRRVAYPVIFGWSAHRLCCGMPDWAWQVGWGREAPDEDGDRCLRHSLAGSLWHLGGWMDGGYLFRHEKRIADIRLSDDLVREKFPDQWPPLFGDDETDAPGDEPGPDAMTVRQPLRTRVLRKLGS